MISYWSGLITQYKSRLLRVRLSFASSLRVCGKQNACWPVSCRTCKQDTQIPNFVGFAWE